MPTLERRTLDRVLELRLRLHEVDRFGFERRADRRDRQELRRRSARVSHRRTKFRAELDRLGLDDEKLRQLIARQISILAYVEERLGPRVFVSVDDIRRYYDEELVPELRGDAASRVPALE